MQCWLWVFPVEFMASYGGVHAYVLLHNKNLTLVFIPKKFNINIFVFIVGMYVECFYEI